MPENIVQAFKYARNHFIVVIYSEVMGKIGTLFE